PDGHHVGAEGPRSVAERADRHQRPDGHDGVGLQRAGQCVSQRRRSRPGAEVVRGGPGLRASRRQPAPPGRRDVGGGDAQALAQIDFQEHAYADARDHVREAVTLAEHFLGTAPGRAAPAAIDNGRRQAAQGLTLLAKAELALDDKDAADAALKRAAQYSRLVGLVEVDLEIRTTAGQLALARNDPSAALAEIQRALPEAERIGRTGNLVQLYQLQARSFAGLRRPADALTSI